MSKWIEAAKAMRAAMDAAGAMLTDEQAAMVPALYRAWENGLAYHVGERRTCGESLFRCLQDHTAQDGRTPADTPSLWARVLASGAGEALPWGRPENAKPYQMGDKVTHGGEIWVCIVDNNKWEPGEYGWARA